MALRHIKLYRQKSGYSQQELANKIRISQKSISVLETRGNDGKVVSDFTLKRIADVLNFPYHHEKLLEFVK